MKKLLTISIILAALLNPAKAQTREWTAGELLGGVSVGGLLVADWLQTRHGMRQTVTVIDYTPGYYRSNSEVQAMYETNPLLGRHPSQGKINLYFLIMIPAIMFAADYFEDYRKEILFTVGLAETITIRSNIQHGMKIRF